MAPLGPMDFQTLNALAAYGDDKAAIRDIIHYVYFEGEDEARDEGFVVRAHHDGTLNEVDLGERLSTIRKLAVSFSGDHDGWEAALVLKA